MIFDIGLSEISLIDLANNQNVKSGLKDAEKFLKEGKIEKSLEKVALAFAQLVDDYEDKKRDQFGRSPFFFGDSMTFVGTGYVGNSFVQLVPKEVTESIEALQNAVKILSLRIDYRKYAKFRLLTPVVMRFIGGKYDTQFIGKEKKVSQDEVNFCIDFVIESAVILQDFDFSN